MLILCSVKTEKQSCKKKPFVVYCLKFVKSDRKDRFLLMGEYGLRVCSKIIVLFIAMLAGFIAKKTKCIDGAGIKTMSALLAFITNPCLIVVSLQTDCKPEILVTGAWILLLSFVIHGGMAVCSGLIFKKVKKADERAVYAFGLMYMNCGFMGYPIMQAMFPENGLLYGVIYTIPFNLFVWTHGVAVMSASHDGGAGEKKIDWKQVFLNPGLLSTILASVLFITGIRFPGVVTEGLSMVGDMTFPLSMLIIGGLLSDINLLALITDIRLFLFSVLKLVAVPLAVLGLFVLCGARPNFTVALVCVTMCAAPTASNTAVVAEVYGGNAPLAAKLVGITTLYSLVTMPAMLILAERFLI